MPIENSTRMLLPIVDCCRADVCTRMENKLRWWSWWCWRQRKNNTNHSRFGNYDSATFMTIHNSWNFADIVPFSQKVKHMHAYIYVRTYIRQWQTHFTQLTEIIERAEPLCMNARNFHTFWNERACRDTNAS